MAVRTELPELVVQKLAAFEQLQPEFERCFLFIEQVQGKQRFTSLSVADVVRYLHALWISECKISLLSIPRTVKGYDSLFCLNLLQNWQEDEDVAAVVSFLYRKLDMLPVVEITRQIQEARRTNTAAEQIQRLVHGRQVMLSRQNNLTRMLDALFSLSPEELARQVQQACEVCGHRPDQIEQQRAAMQGSLYTFVPHQVLAERNMLVMNTLARQTMDRPTNPTAQRASLVQQSHTYPQPLAETVIPNYQDMTSSAYNNLMQGRFVNPSTQKHRDL
ncbi:hypothetical protein [Dictyobacter formicarum]|uniref:DUF4158 domain-containing protein n=1 Tax=Dictyobacter formicarum TaxID=2778368 RepID=A0ABQ3VKG3_9CHLR|nr:hypothetical protein [Dictyobacter formicarum]GHO86166.1 hypothetical protein KSZ_41720 [Dictyobacter formicarum]